MAEGAPLLPLPFSPFPFVFRPAAHSPAYPAAMPPAAPKQQQRRGGSETRIIHLPPSRPPTTPQAQGVTRNGLGNALRQLTAVFSWRAPPRPIEGAAQRLLVVASRGDRLVHCSCSERIAAHYGARRARLPDNDFFQPPPSC